MTETETEPNPLLKCYRDQDRYRYREKKLSILKIRILPFSILLWKTSKQTRNSSLNKHKLIRPCERQNFPNFLFSQVSELFGFWSSEIFRKYLVFLNSQKFCEHNSEISIFGSKNPVFESKHPDFGSKNPVF